MSYEIMALLRNGTWELDPLKILFDANGSIASNVFQIVPSLNTNLVLLPKASINVSILIFMIHSVRSLSQQTFVLFLQFLCLMVGPFANWM